MVNWGNVGIEGQGTPAVQGGHILVDVERGWRFLAISDWLSQHSDYYYRYGGYGEQGSHEIALATGQCPYTIIGDCRTSPPSVILVDYDGRPLAVHRIAKLWPDCVPKWNRDLPGEASVQKIYRELAGPRYWEAAARPCGGTRPAGNQTLRATRLRNDRRQILTQR